MVKVELKPSPAIYRHHGTFTKSIYKQQTSFEERTTGRQASRTSESKREKLTQGTGNRKKSRQGNWFVAKEETDAMDSGGGGTAYLEEEWKDRRRGRGRCARVRRSNCECRVRVTVAPPPTLKPSSAASIRSPASFVYSLHRDLATVVVASVTSFDVRIGTESSH